MANSIFLAPKELTLAVEPPTGSTVVLTLACLVMISEAPMAMV